MKGWLKKMSKFKDYITEASFSNPSLNKVVKLIIKSLTGKVGSKFYPFGGEGNNFEKFNKSNGNKGIGMIYVLDDGRLIRFNWETNKKSSTITSLDIWNDMKSIEHPDFNLDIPENYNIVQSMELLASFIKRPVKRELSEMARPFSQARYDKAERYGIDVNLETKEFNKLVLKAMGSEKKLMAGKKGVKEVSSTSKAMVAGEKAFNSKKIADPEIIFKDLDDLITMVATNVQKSLLITGMAGIGKTFAVQKRVKEILGPEGDKWIFMKGKSSPLGLYSTLFIHRNDLIVFDDMDSVFANKDTVNMLKSALDSYDERRISWISPITINVAKLTPAQKEELYISIEDKLSTDPANSKIKYPSQFEFTGRIIFISNIHESKMDKAIKSRSFVIDITLKAQDVFKRMESILKDIAPEANIKEKRIVLDFLKAEKVGGQQTNMRTLINAIKCKQSGSSRWQHLAKHYA